MDFFRKIFQLQKRMYKKRRIRVRSLLDSKCKKINQKLKERYNLPQMKGKNNKKNDKIIQNGSIILQLRYTGFTDAKMKALCLEQTHKVERLVLGPSYLYPDSNPLTKLSFMYFQKANWEALTHLSLADNKIGNKGCRFLAKSRMPNLKELRLFSNKIKTEGFSLLTKVNWNELQTLCIWDNKLGPGSMNWMIRATWPNTTQLFLHSNLINPFDIWVLALSQYKHLVAAETDIEDCTCRRMQSIFSKKQVRIRSIPPDYDEEEYYRER